MVARARESRQQLARLLAQHLLAADVPRDRIPLRRFDLSVLQRPFDFPTDPEDGIERVRVNRLRLTPIGSVGERVTLECLRGSTCALPEMAQHRFGTHDPLLGGWLITQAKLTIRFCARGNGGGRTLPLTITLPNGCDLKDRTERERLIGEKYLRRWGLLQDV